MDFTKNGNTYETTFSASTPFNIHIERDGGRVLSVSRRTAGEGWETIEIIRQGRVIDADVYNDISREFRIQSDVEPAMCEITFGTAVGGEIEFTIKDYNGSTDYTFKAREGMTWREFCDSAYNTEGWYIDETAWVYLYEGEGWGNPVYYAYEQDYGLPIADRVINPNAVYITHQEGGIGGGGGGE
jgi:hypothetical protein